MPPSVLLAYYVAYNANQTHTPRRRPRSIRSNVSSLRWSRPEETCGLDCACSQSEVREGCSDRLRWPANLAEQRVFTMNCGRLLFSLLTAKGSSSARNATHSEDLFGERPRATPYASTPNSTSTTTVRQGLSHSAQWQHSGTGSAAVPSTARATPRSSPGVIKPSCFRFPSTNRDGKMRALNAASVPACCTPWMDGCLKAHFLADLPSLSGAARWLPRRY